MTRRDPDPDPQAIPSAGWAVVASALLVFLLLVAFERAFAMVFVLNFTTEGPGPTLALIVLLLSGFLYPLGLHRWWPHSIRFLDASVVAATNLVYLSLFPLPALAAVGSLVAFLVATPLLFTLVTHLRARFAEGAVLGILIHQAGRAWTDTAPYGATATGWTWTVVAGVAFFALWLLFVRPRLAAGDPSAELPPRPHLVTPFLFIVYVHLGAPVVIARWLGEALLPVWGAAVAGLILGIVVLRFPRRDAPLLVITSAVLLVIGLIDIVATAFLPLLTYPLAIAASVHLFAVDLQHPGKGGIRRVGSETGGLQVVALIAVFLHATAPSWAFLPAPLGVLVHSQAALYLMILGTLLVAGLLLLPFLRTLPHPVLRVPRVPEPPFASAIALAVLVAAGGLAVHETIPEPLPGAAPPVRVATYNIHQYFSVGQTGHYNLEAVAEVIHESGAQVVGLQETEGARITSGNLDGVRWLAHRLDMHHAHGPPASHQMYGVALLSVYPILEATWIDLPAHQSVERAAMIAQLDTPFGVLPVLVTHLQIEKFVADRLSQVGAIVDWSEDIDRAWILGDFNTPPRIDDPAYLLLTGHFEDAWVAAGNRPDVGPTQIGSTVDERIDHIWLKGDWVSEACRIYGDGMASDHRLVACDLTPRHWVGETT